MISLERPQVRPPAAWSFPDPVDTTLSNGIPLSVFHRPGQHVASVQVVIPLPATLEPADREGLATIVSRTMDEGTRSHTADEFAGLLEGSGIALAASQTLLGLTVQLEVATGALRPALELALECLSEPAFPEEEVSRHVAQRLSDIEHELADPGSRAALEWIDAYYDPTARASRPVAGRTATVRAIDAAACRDFHAAHVTADGARVLVAGDLDAAEVHAAVDATLGTWSTTGTGSAGSGVLDLPRAGGDHVVFVHRPGSVQTQVQLGWGGPSRRVDGGWAPYPVLAYLVGGSPGARVDRVLREDKGYTYGFGAGFRPRGASGTFVAGGSVRGDVTAPAVELLWEVLDGVADGFTQEELRSGVDYVGMTAPGRYATADAVADEAAALALDGLDTGFVTDYLRDLRGLTAEDLAQAWARWGRQPRTLVLVGDAEAHADAVRALGRGDVTVV
ncbi:pitrilysin family protein [Allobranchiibius sp. GilTou73]|uniref:M16 family metallopeptidase n=1 Tax=Allobranchiibius sp. GilTou73 TaxID=2904523 RepID=UPI001F198899|nr:pitrilysin family protein [Allobranchiibius sp. GilTou73]UIJ34688.1 insulinase family protein [Allobranchiibius sp. GilTou73]